MLFKNAKIYQLTSPVSVTGAALAEKEFQPCGAHDRERNGFTKPLGGDGQLFTHTVGDFTMICMRRQEKVLPGASVHEELAKKVAEIEQHDGRKVGGRERAGIKEEIIFSMLPRAFTRSSLTYAYIDARESLIVIDTASEKRAEELLCLLREAVGSLAVRPLTTKLVPAQVMTRWLQECPTVSFPPGGEVELRSARDDSLVKAKNFDLDSDEVLAHIQSGMMVSKLELQHESASFIVDESLTLKRIKFSGLVLEKSADNNPETAVEQFDSDFSVMTLELREIIGQLVMAFGGCAHATRD